MAHSSRNSFKTMANETPFDLNHAIQRWRENLTQSPAFRSENLNKLESHLRDSVDTLQAKGLTAEEAFVTAARQTGTNKALQGEYGKANRTAVWFERALWVLLATQFWFAIRSISNIAFGAGSSFVELLNWNRAVPGEPALTVVGVVFSPLVIAAVIGIEWWRYTRRKRRPALFFRQLLQRPLNLALMLFAVCALLSAIPEFLFRAWWRWNIPMLYHNLGYYPRRATLSVQLFEYAVLALLTFFVARKRLRTTAASNVHPRVKPESFDLNLAIQRWRENLAQSPAFEPENLNELESHLRDSVSAIQAKGLSAEEAFVIAERRIGACPALEGEFGKVNGAAIWFERALWVLLATQLWSIVCSISMIGFIAGSWLVRTSAYSWALAMLNWDRGISQDWVPAVFSLVSPPLVIATGLLWWRFVRRKQQEASFFRKLLQRPASLALIFFVLCALFRIIAGCLIQMWYTPMLYHVRYYNSQIGSVFVHLYVNVILASLTFWVARKRLRAVPI